MNRFKQKAAEVGQETHRTSVADRIPTVCSYFMALQAFSDNHWRSESSN